MTQSNVNHAASEMSSCIEDHLRYAGLVLCGLIMQCRFLGELLPNNVVSVGTRSKIPAYARMTNSNLRFHSYQTCRH